MNNIPISPEIVKTLAKTIGIPDPGSCSIREIVHLVNKIEEKTGVKFIRMEMGVPGLPAPSIGIEAEINALKNGVAAIYPNITGISQLKKRHPDLLSFSLMST
jgi:aspartate/methionine/tyrosine aminotransferase